MADIQGIDGWLFTVTRNALVGVRCVEVFCSVSTRAMLQSLISALFLGGAGSGRCSDRSDVICPRICYLYYSFVQPSLAERESSLFEHRHREQPHVVGIQNTSIPQFRYRSIPGTMYYTADDIEHIAFNQHELRLMSRNCSSERRQRILAAILDSEGTWSARPTPYAIQAQEIHEMQV